MLARQTEEVTAKKIPRFFGNSRRPAIILFTYWVYGSNSALRIEHNSDKVCYRVSSRSLCAIALTK